MLPRSKLIPIVLFNHPSFFFLLFFFFSLPQFYFLITNYNYFLSKKERRIRSKNNCFLMRLNHERDICHVVGCQNNDCLLGGGGGGGILDFLDLIN